MDGGTAAGLGVLVLCRWEADTYEGGVERWAGVSWSELQGIRRRCEEETRVGFGVSGDGVWTKASS